MFRKIPFGRTDDSGRQISNNGSELINCYAVNAVDAGSSKSAYIIQSTPAIHRDFKFHLRTIDEIEDAEQGVHGMVTVQGGSQERVFGLTRNSYFFELLLNKDFDYRQARPLPSSDTIDDFPIPVNVIEGDYDSIDVFFDADNKVPQNAGNSPEVYFKGASRYDFLGLSKYLIDYYSDDNDYLTSKSSAEDGFCIKLVNQKLNGDIHVRGEENIEVINVDDIDIRFIISPIRFNGEPIYNPHISNYEDASIRGSGSQYSFETSLDEDEIKISFCYPSDIRFTFVILLDVNDADFKEYTPTILCKTPLKVNFLGKIGQNETYLETPLSQYTTNDDYELANGQVTKLVTDGRYVMFAVNGRVFLRDTENDTWPINDGVQYTALEEHEAVDIEQIDGYFFIAVENGLMYHTNITDPTSVDALNVVSAESNPDDIVVLSSLHRRLYVFGKRTVEVFYNNGGSSFAFKRDNSYIFNVGCANKDTVQKNDVVIFFLGSDHIVYAVAGNNYQPISSDSVEFDIQSSDLSKARAFTYTEEGHKFYSLTIMKNNIEINWTYDMTTNLWHKRSDTKISACVPFGQRPALLGLTSGGATLRQMSLDSVAEERRDIISILPVLHANMHTTTVSNFQVDYNQEVVDGGGSVTLQYSDDNNITWSLPYGREQELSNKRLRWNSLGKFREGRNFRITVNTDRTLVMDSAAVELKVQKR